LRVNSGLASDMLAVIVLFAACGAYVSAQPMNLLINGGCESSGGSACTTNTTCPIGSWWLLSTDSACGVWCTDGEIQSTGNINGWTQQASGVNQCGFACVYQNIVESPLYGGRVIGAPYEGSSFLSEITANCSVFDTAPILSHVINFPGNAYPAIDAGLVTVYAFAAGAVANDTSLVIQVKFRNSAFNQIGTSIFLSISSDVGEIPSNITWQTGSSTTVPPAGTTMMQVQIQSHTVANEFSPFAQIDGVTVYAYSPACFEFPEFPTGQTNSSNCNTSYTMPGGTCELECLPSYMSSGGNFTAVCNSSWTVDSMVYNNWLIGSGTCVPTNSASASHESHSASHSTSHSHSPSHSHSHPRSHSHSHSHSHPQSHSHSHSDSHSHSHPQSHSHSHSHSDSRTPSYGVDSHSTSNHSHSHHSPAGTRSHSHHSKSHHSKSHASASHDSKSHHSKSHASASHDSKSHHSKSHASASHDSKSHHSKSHASASHDSKSHHSKSHDSKSHNKTHSGSHSHSHSHRSKSHHSLNETRSHSHHSRSPSHHSQSHRSKSHRSKSHRSKSHHSESHHSKSKHSDSHSKSHHSKSHESPSQSETAAAATTTFPAPDLVALIVLLPIIGCLVLSAIVILMWTRRYRQRPPPESL